MSSTTSPVTSDEISSRSQDAKWSAPRLIAVGGTALAIAIALIIVASKLIGE